MPRTGGIFYLLSPPAPLLAGTLAAAEDVMSILQDIAAGLTGSMAVDGSTAFTGPINFNGQAITGIGNLSASGTISAPIINGTSYVTAPTYYGTNIQVSGFIQSNGAGRIISNGSGNNPSVTVWDPSQNYAAGMFIGSGANLFFGAMDGSGNFDGGILGYFTDTGVFDAQGGLSTPASINASGSLGIAGNGTISGTLSVGALAIDAGDLQMNGHNILNLNIVTASGGAISFYNDLNMNGHNVLNIGALYGAGGQIVLGTYVNCNGQNLFNANAVQATTVTANNFIQATRAGPPSQPLAAVQAMARQRVGDLDIAEAISTLLAAVAELSHAALPAPA